MRNKHRILSGKAEGNRWSQRPIYTWDNIIKMDLKRNWVFGCGLYLYCSR
jgi:hypothetical protein